MLKQISKFIVAKKAQLGIIEAKFFVIGLIMGIIAGIILIYLANSGMLPFKLSFVCPNIAAK